LRGEILGYNTRPMNKIVLAAVLFLLSLLAACGGGSMSPPPPSSSLSLALASGSTVVFPGSADLTVNATITRMGTTGNVTLTIQGLPAGATSKIQSPGSGNSGSITVGAGTATAGSYVVSVTASDGTVQTSGSFTLDVGAGIQIGTATNGRLQLAMSTSFQPAEWDYNFFQLYPTATTPLGNLLPQHIRLQGVSQGVPQTTSTSWDFTDLDAITQPVLGVGDHSPEFQIAKAPPFMYVNNDSGNSFVDTSFVQFAQYTQNLVRYYNTGGFSAADGTHVSPSGTPITWWGIYNEPEFNNNLTPELYVKLYNAVVPAMQAIDPNIKFVGMEFASYQPERWVPPFVSGVTAHVDAVATHFYSTCNQTDDDQKIFDTVPNFAEVVQQDFFAQMQTNPALASVPLWITENNVNADYDKGGGISACNGTTFVTDQRGSSAFFAAWRPYVFSQLGKIGVRALYHWDFNADQQFGEFNANNGQLLLSYWVDYWLARIFASPPGADILEFTQSNTPDGLEILPVQNSDGSVVIMVANHAVKSSSDNNGAGAPRSILLDVSALGTFTTASTLTLDANTSPTTGPAPVSVTPASQMTLTLNGYGVVFLTLK
jgi:hypothetical protein